jgi:hypothetical protein
MKSFAINLLVAVLLGGSAWGQTTQPAVDPWPQALNAAAQSILEGKIDDLRRLSTPDLQIQSFDSPVSENETRLLARGSLSSLIGVHAYIHPPMGLAADIAVDCKNAADFPDAMREKMIPKDDADMQRANATAAQWLSQKLGAADGDHVGVIVLYWNGEPARNATSIDRASPELIFVLVSGVTTDLHNFQIQRIIYGNPLAAAE